MSAVWGAGVLSLTLALLIVAASELAIIGGDAEWLNAMGKIIVDTGHIPAGVPYAATASNGWPNVPALAELAFYAAARLDGDRGLLMLQVLAVLGSLLAISTDARRAGASQAGTATALVLLGAGGATGLLIIRVQLFSLVLFPVLLLILRLDRSRCTSRLWLAVPLLALWSNLHGAVLIGYGVTATYLLTDRRKRTPIAAVGMLAACTVALCATPSLWRTPLYYRGLVLNESAQQSTGLWARLSLSSPFDVTLLLVLALFALGVWRARPAFWEVIAIVELAFLTANAARSGLWLLLLAAPTAAAGLSRGMTEAIDLTHRSAAVGLSAGATCLAIVCVAFRAMPISQTDDRLLALAIRQAHGGVIVSEGAAAERVAVAGGCLWMANPLDAFSPRAQRRFLGWLGDGDMQRLPLDTRAVVVRRHSAAGARLAASPAYRLLDRSASFDLYRPLPLAANPVQACPGRGG
ncbi:MAG: hypothetical protein NVS3B26_10250 [Mycobacteriales bacterium]